MQHQIKVSTWEELISSSALVKKRLLVKRYLLKFKANIMNSSFGEVIMVTGGVKKFFAGQISIGEMIISHKVNKARR